MAAIAYCAAEAALIKSLWHQGKTGSQIAAASNSRFQRGRSRNAIIGYVHRNGLPPRGEVPPVAHVAAVSPRAARASSRLKVPAMPAAKPAAPKPVASKKPLPKPRPKKMRGGAMRDAERRANEVRLGTRRQAKAPPKRPLAEAKDQAPLNLTVLELSDRTCRYPVTDDLPHRFCGHSPVPGKVYCAAHHAIILRKDEAA